MDAQTWELSAFGLDNLRLQRRAVGPPGPGEVLVDVRALSLNYRDLLVLEGAYNPRLRLPAVPLSDAAGVVIAAGAGVTRVRPQERIVTHFVAGWLDGRFHDEYRGTTLGTPGPGLAAERVVLPADAVLPLPDSLSFEEGATLPIAALTAWSALESVRGATRDGRGRSTVLTLGTGGVSVFAVQLAKALGARVMITSSSDEKLARAAALGADLGINYRSRPDWAQAALEATGGAGADVVVETAGGTLNESLRATRAGGIVALLGVLAGVSVELATTTVLMRRLRIVGIMVDSRAEFERLLAFIVEQQIQPVIDRRFAFSELPAALACMKAAKHFGKIVVTT